MKGKVKWYHPVKGYGFIETEQRGESKDTFFHISEIEDYKQAKIEIGEEVEFELGDSKKGKKAIKIKKIQKEE